MASGTNGQAFLACLATLTTLIVGFATLGAGYQRLGFMRDLHE